MKFSVRTCLFACTAGIAFMGVPASAQDAGPASEAPPAEEIAAPISDPAEELRTAAEAIDPLADSAGSEAAWAAYLDALEQAGGSVVRQATALNRIGDARYYQQNFPGALESSLEAKRRLETAGETAGEAMAETLANVAVFYSVTGEGEKELELQERSLAIRRALYGDDPLLTEDKKGAKALGLGYLNYATALYQRGRFSEAAEYIQPSIDGLIHGELRDATLFVAMSSGANMLVDANRNVEAFALAERGVELANQLLPEGHPFIGFAQATLAKVLLQSDRYAEAEGPARRALDIMAAKLGPDHPNTLTALHNLGVIQARLGNYQAAIDLVSGGLDAQIERDAGEGIMGLVSVSNSAFEAGDADLALSFAQRAVGLGETLEDTNRKAENGMLTYALRLEERGRFAEARDQVDAVAARIEARGDDVAPDIRIRQGLLAIRTGEAQAGWQQVETASKRLEQEMLDQAGRFELGADLPSYYEPIMQVAEAAIAAGDADAALHAFELASWGVNARSRQLVALRDTAGLDAETAALVDGLRQGRENLRRLHRERAAMLAADQVDTAAAHAAEIERTAAQVEQASAALGSRVPNLAAWLRPATPDVATVRNSLSPDQALLIAMPARHRTLVMAITSQGAVMADGTAGRSAVREHVARLRAALDAGAPLSGDPAAGFPFEAAAALHDIVLPENIAAALAGRSEVSVVTSDALSRLPFGVLMPGLPTRDQRDMRDMDWLARSHAFAIALTPSQAFAHSDVGARGSGFLGIGAPRLSGGSDGAVDASALYRGSEISIDDIRALPALPATASEVEQVARAIGDAASVTLLGDAATEERVRAESAQMRNVVLFATHGLLGGEIGGLREPALVLTPPVEASGQSNDGLLQASEIAALGMAADFVILSACNSAAGRNMTAPAYTGLANAFLGSGTRSLLLSHWRVRDDAAAFLSTRTVRGAAEGVTRAQALRQAQLALMESDLPAAGHPAVWAPFVLIGD